LAARGVLAPARADGLPDGLIRGRAGEPVPGVFVQVRRSVIVKLRDFAQVVRSANETADIALRTAPRCFRPAAATSFAPVLCSAIADSQRGRAGREYPSPG